MPVVSGTQYATRADLANLGLIGGVLAQIPGSVQDAALLAASAVADSFLQSRYTLPLTQWGQDLVRVVCHIAADDIMASKGYMPAAGADPYIGQRRDRALAWLASVSKDDDTPVGIIDSSTPGTPSDGSTATTSTGGLQLQTSEVRGWTRRGDPGPVSSEFWDGKF